MHDHTSSDNDGLDADAFVPSWPVRVAQIYLDVLPAVGAGVNMPAVLADVDGDGVLEVGVTTVAGFYYIFRGNGTSFYGRDSEGRDIPLPIFRLSYGANSNTADGPAFAAMGGGIFADLGAGMTLIAPTGRLVPCRGPFTPGKPALFRSADQRLESGNRQVRARVSAPGQRFRILTTASVADITGDGAPEVLAPSSVFDIHAVDRNGREAPNWPKLTGEAVNGTPACWRL
jgi:hypothetical protein